MLTASCFLIAIGLLGAFDIAWFHTWRGQLTRRAECRSESVVHVARGFVYAAQFLVVPNLRFHGRWHLALVALFVVDAAIAVTDVLLEPGSRAKQGGLRPAEYLIHIVLSVLVGGLLHAVFSATWGDWAGNSRLSSSSLRNPMVSSGLLIGAAGHRVAWHRVSPRARPRPWRRC